MLQNMFESATTKVPWGRVADAAGHPSAAHYQDGAGCKVLMAQSRVCEQRRQARRSLPAQRQAG
jgi:hypothetical protein